MTYESGLAGYGIISGLGPGLIHGPLTLAGLRIELCRGLRLHEPGEMGLIA